jgi:ectoine hydroxylase-related dioxygenase (phytanoyl-CoA dioxygenase family)
VDGEQVCSVWLPLDPVPRSVSPEFVAGSHRWGKTFTPRKFMDHRPYEGSLTGYETVPDIDSRRDEYEILSWDLEPGDCIVFHMKSLHGAPGTAEHRFRRRAFSTRWLGDDAVFATRPFPTSPPFPGLKLKPGEPMEHELFPVVYRG